MASAGQEGPDDPRKVDELREHARHRHDAEDEHELRILLRHPLERVRRDPAQADEDQRHEGHDLDDLHREREQREVALERGNADREDDERQGVREPGGADGDRDGLEASQAELIDDRQGEQGVGCEQRSHDDRRDGRVAEHETGHGTQQQRDRASSRARRRSSGSAAAERAPGPSRARRRASAAACPGPPGTPRWAGSPRRARGRAGRATTPLSSSPTTGGRRTRRASGGTTRMIRHPDRELRERRQGRRGRAQRFDVHVARRSPTVARPEPPIGARTGGLAGRHVPATSHAARFEARRRLL